MSAFADPSRLYFFFDYLSHNAYLAWHRAPELAARHKLTLTPVPVVFGALLSHYRQVGPAELPAKSLWMLRNVLRKALMHGIPIAPPASHPFNPLLPLRVTCAVEEPRRAALADRLFRATWAEGRTVSEPDTVRALLGEGGLPPVALLAAAATEPGTPRLRENTEQALALGIFGVPTLRARGELFWGFDDLEYLDMFLSGRDVLSADRRELAGWMSVRPSVERKRP